MERDEMIKALECVLFVSGEPVYIDELCRVFHVNKTEMRETLKYASEKYENENRGIIFFVTDESVQLISNRFYSNFVEELLQPVQTKSFSQAMLETLTIVAYRQPVTRAEIDSIRGVHSDYSITQLIKQGFIAECGRKEVVGRPQLLGTTDKFLRKFGIHSVDELPNYTELSSDKLFDTDVTESSENKDA